MASNKKSSSGKPDLDPPKDSTPKGREPSREFPAVMDTATSAGGHEALQHIFTILKDRTGHDFSSYKRSTILRRIERRMNTNAAGGLDTYLDILENKTNEAQELCQELLIGVTSFFRDPDAFEILRSEIIPCLFADRDTEEPIRIWHACCATGEEVYSVAMLIAEYLELEKLQRKVQIFATDLDKEAVAQARSGTYSDDITLEVSDDRLKRFFVRNEGQWQVTQQLREMVVFAHHNIIKDPPFSRLDLLVCRNFLIYLNPDIQKLLIPLFHQVLRPGGYLFLGSAETVGIHSDLFHPINKRWKIFLRQRGDGRVDALFPFADPVRKLADIERSVQTSGDQEDEALAHAEKILLERYAPARVIINEKNEVIHFSKQAGVYLLTPEGKPTRDLLKKAREELRPALRAATYRAFTTQEEIEYRGIKIIADDGEASVNIIVVPLKEPPPANRLALVIIEPAAPSPALSAPNDKNAPDEQISRDALIRQLEGQLRVTSEQLQSTNEQLETSQEKFILTNEELMTVNEELQSTNEELQSTNEEVVTVNSELHRKMEELNQSNTDLENLFASSGIAIIFLDRELVIKRFSPAMALIFNLIPADIGRPFRHLNGAIDWSNLPNDAASVLESLAPVEREVNSLNDNRTFIMQTLPYQTMEGVIDGIVITLMDISDRKAIEKENRKLLNAVQQEKDRLTALIDSITDEVWFADKNKKITLANPSALRAFGFNGIDQIDIEKFAGSLEIYCADGSLRPLQETPLLRTLHGEVITNMEEIIRNPATGELRYREVCSNSVRDTHDNIIGAVSVVRDITDRRHAENALRETRTKMDAAMASMTDAVFISDADGQFIDFNDAFATFHRFPNKAACSKKLIDYQDILDVFMANGEPAPLERWAVPRALQGETVTNAEFTLRRKDTSETWVGSFSFGPIRDSRGEIIGAVVVAHDITERIRSAEALRNSEQLYRSLFDNMLNGFAYCKMFFVEDRPEDFIYLNVNPAFETLTGLKNVIGKKVSEVIPGIRQSDQQLFEVYGRVALSGIPEQFETYVESLKMWFSISVYSPQKEYFVAVFDVITERKMAQEALVQSEQRRSLTLEAAQVGTWEWDLQTNENIWSNELWLLYGLEPHSCKPSYEEWRNVVHPEDRSETERTLQEAVLQGVAYNTEWRVNLNNGNERWLMSRGRPLKDAQGRIVRYLGIVMDITEHKRAEQEKKDLQAQLIQAQKMDAIGTLAGGVAHDFNNMLNVIMGYTEIALEGIEQDHPLHNDLTEVFNAARRSAEITRQLLAFARKQTIDPVVLDLNETIGGMLKMLQRLLGENISLSWNPKLGLWPIKMDPVQIDQILANLCVNARDAIADVGKIILMTDNIFLDEQYCAHHPDSTSGEYVMLAVTDTGCGMDQETLARIFEPFYTTKGVGRGTGLGMSTVYGIVRQNNCAINVCSEAGSGTTIRVYIPHHYSEQQVATIRETPPILKGNGETVLLVEDESTVRKLGRALLERSGYAVLTASAPNEALTVAEEHGGKIDMLITDVVMPEMNGKELANRVQDLYPQIKILFMSGYTADAIAHHGVLDDGVNFIQKPFLQNDLIHKVHAVLHDFKNTR